MSKADYYNLGTTIFYNPTIRKNRTVHFIALFTGSEHYQNLQSLHFLLLG